MTKFNATAVDRLISDAQKVAKDLWQQGKAAMRQVIVLLLLAVASSSAAAAWVLVGKTEISTLYADAFMPQEGDVVKMWNLSDFNASRIFNPRVATYSSMVRQEEFNCKEERMRTLYLEFNTRNMGAGDVIFSNSAATRWSPVSPRQEDSGPRPTDRLFFEIACRKR